MAAAALFVDRNWAWLGIDATLPDYRSRGAQTSLIARRIQDGLASGVGGHRRDRATRSDQGMALRYQSGNEALKILILDQVEEGMENIIQWAKGRTACNNGDADRLACQSRSIDPSCALWKYWLLTSHPFTGRNGKRQVKGSSGKLVHR